MKLIANASASKCDFIKFRSSTAFRHPRARWASHAAARSKAVGCSDVGYAAASPLAPTVSSSRRHASPSFCSIERAIDAIANGEFILVLDDEDRENEGDLIIAAEKVTPQKIAYMVEFTSGVLCVALPATECQRLDLPLMVSSAENEEAMYTAFTVTVDARDGITTGISASDRCKTIQALGNPATRPHDLRRPGHVFPLIAREGGVLARPGHTEAAVDLARLAGCHPAGVLSEVVDKRTGEMARTPQLLAMAAQHSMPCITIEALQEFLVKHNDNYGINGNAVVHQTLSKHVLS